MKEIIAESKILKAVNRELIDEQFKSTKDQAMCGQTHHVDCEWHDAGTGDCET